MVALQNINPSSNSIFSQKTFKAWEKERKDEKIQNISTVIT